MRAVVGRGYAVEKQEVDNTKAKKESNLNSRFICIYRHTMRLAGSSKSRLERFSELCQLCPIMCHNTSI